MKDRWGFDLPEDDFDIGACDLCRDETEPRRPLRWRGTTVYACASCRGAAARNVA